MLHFSWSPEPQSRYICINLQQDVAVNEVFNNGFQALLDSFFFFVCLSFWVLIICGAAGAAVFPNRLFPLQANPLCCPKKWSLC